MKNGALVKAPSHLRFRGKLMAALMLAVTSVTGLVLLITQRHAESVVQATLHREFQARFDELLSVQSTRLAAITGRCRALARSVRIRAALEENDEHDLYANAAIELRELLDGGSGTEPQAQFLRFLDHAGKVMPQPDAQGHRQPEPWEKQLAMNSLRGEQQLGYIELPAPDGLTTLSEIIATPMVTTDTGEIIGAIVLGFAASELEPRTDKAEALSGLWRQGQLRLPTLSEAARRALSQEVQSPAGAAPNALSGRPVEVEGAPYLLFSRLLNPGSVYAPVSQISLYPLRQARAEQRQRRWQILESGGVLLLGSLLLSHFLSGRLSAPVVRLAVDSREHRTQRERAEAALEVMNEELRMRNAELQAALTELKATQQFVIQQERLRALGEMASGIAHDFNNALVPVLGFCELLLLSPKTLSDQVKARRYLETIQTAAQDAASVVGRLREFYRPAKNDRNFSPVNLQRIAEQAITLTRPRWKDQALAKGVTVQIVSDLQPVPDVSGEESALREVLTNLIFNAVDAMSQGGTITLRTHSLGDRAMLEVADTGSGMTEEVRQKCLEPFFSTKGERGTGLGLSMVFGIIQRHSGLLELRSELGRGTTFTITLPLLEATAPATPESAATAAHARSLRVLVVEDEAPIRETLAAILTADGHQVSLAHDGAAGLREFQSGGTFDLVVSDKAMPHMNGDQMAKAIKQLSPKTPIVLLTGFGLFYDKSDFPDVNVLTSKPIRIPTLRAAIASALETT